jgi:caa(3)-type oxidase subunit IV
VTSVHERHYLIIWLWLVALVGISVAAVAVLPKFQALAVIFSSAIVKALLVVRNYMHLKNERPIYYAMALVPLAFVIILLFGLFPDFVYHANKP